MIFGMRENGERFCIYTCFIDKFYERVFVDRSPHPTSFEPLFMVSLLFLLNV